ncbi:MAG: AAC(3) family N-acetyltransferase [Erysipelotrichia bacterium]|nr:AAC(3) family N-acetyltransferase [Erysipelotrichia bacterium]NCC54266.1 AAC(3) family N-acetyltransferase [Erysipelotrichia bacterium]
MVRKHENYQSLICINDIITKQDIVAFLKSLGIGRGMILYVQSNLHQFAFINGHYQTLIEAIQEVITYEGTLVVPSFSEGLLDPACHLQYCFARDVYEEMRESTQAFHKKRTPADNELANQLMRNDAVYRSNHPLHSCVAWGKYAKLMCDKHPLHFSLGKDSFLDKVCEMNGYVLLLGVPYQDCDIFKYAATLVGKAPVKIISSPIDKKGIVEYVDMLDITYSNKGITHIKKMMEERSVVKDNFIGNAHCRFFKAKEATNLALAYYHSFD